MHSVGVLPVDINHSDWDCTLAPTARVVGSDVIPKWDWGNNGPSVRLGLRMIRGLQEKYAQQMVDARKAHVSFRSLEHFAKATALPAHAIQRLAQADAFGSVAACRRESLWQAMAHHDEAFPLFAGIEEKPEPIQLPVMPVVCEITTDYNTTGLSLKRHPVALIREKLDKRGIIPAAKLNRTPAGRWVKVAGLVLIRQRPGTASGIVFETLEDETGIVNLVVMPDIYEHYRPAARYAKLAQADGYVERQGQVVHVKVQRMQDLTRLIADCDVSSRDFR
jgi:error-prone DNA polymerase